MDRDTWYREAPGAALTQDEREWIREASAEVAEGFAAATLLHLGVGLGASVHCSRAGAPDARIVGVDLDLSRFEARPGAGEVDEFELVQGDSRLCHRDFDERAHFLFIDTDHTEGTVYAELLGWLPRVPVTGIVAFHDYGNSHLRWCAGVKRAVDRWDWSGWREIPAAGSIRAFQREAI